MSQVSRFEFSGCEFCEVDSFGAHAPRCPVTLEKEIERLKLLLNSPEIDNFLRGVHLEAVHQVERWGTADDRAKRPEDWFWLVGYLAGKALHAQKQSIDADARDLKQFTRGATAGAPHLEKALHHCISTAAALYNWHCAIKGVDVRMAPGSSDVAKIVDAAFPGLNIADEAPDKNPVSTGGKPFNPLCDEEDCTELATLHVIDPADGVPVGYACEKHGHVDGLEYRALVLSNVDIGRHIDDHEQYD